ncbi:MAG TPA: hypothetical protein VHB79_21560 [Polyangiaceae bacterium]|nr:hypothetical protein [Polyangiaceae bacterium]
MKLIRLPSGPLACVFPVPVEPRAESDRGAASGVFRAFSGSVEAEAPSEDQAIEALDQEVRRLSVPPSAEVAAFELSRNAANDDERTTSLGPGIASANATGRFARYSEYETLPAPASSSRR